MNKLSLLFLALFSFTFVACDDDEEEPINDVDAIELFVSSGTSSQITVLDYTNDDRVDIKTAAVPYADADGIYYKEGDDRLFQVSRTNNQVAIYDNFRQSIEDGTALTPTYSTMDFTNARGLASDGDKLVVAQDGNAANGETNKLIVYNITSNGLNLLRSHTVNFNVWGLEIEDGRLYVIEDNTNRLSIFDDFFDEEDGSIEADKSIGIEGLVRTHGIHFVDDGDRMILTDVGDGGVDDDGAIFVIDDFKNKVNALNTGDMLMQDQLKTIKGSATLLGNPVDLAYDKETEMIYVAERARDGGRVLVFDYPETSNSDAPVRSEPVPGAASIHLYTDR